MYNNNLHFLMPLIDLENGLGSVLITILKEK